MLGLRTSVFGIAAVILTAAILAGTFWRKDEVASITLPADEPAFVSALPPQMNVLVVGIDQRFGSEKRHCDAIHMIHMDTSDNRIELVNIPRGTRVNITMPNGWMPEPELLELARKQLAEEARVRALQEQATEEQLPLEDQHPVVAQAVTSDSAVARAWSIEQYIANICKYIDFETFVRHAEFFSGHDADYTVRVGFSETQTLLRALDFDPIATLQFLRHRKTYPLGDVQRSYNQAVFIHDLLLERADDVARMPKPVRRALFSLLKTDMSFDTAEQLLAWYGSSGIAEDPSRIVQRTVPSGTPKAQTIHVDEQAVVKQVDELLLKLKHYEPNFAVSDTERAVQAQAYQALFAIRQDMRAHKWQDADAKLQVLKAIPVWLQISSDALRQQATLAAAFADIETSIHLHKTPEESVRFAQTLAEIMRTEQGGEQSAARIDNAIAHTLALSGS